MKKVLRIDDVDVYPMMWLHSMPLHCTLENGYNGKVYDMYIWFQCKKNL